MQPSPFSVIPFILLLLSIAVLPFINRHWWDKNYPYVSLGYGLIIFMYYLVLNKSNIIIHTLEDYLMFISLLTSLFVVTGGILVEIKGLSTPLRNVSLLAIGAVLSNIIGTTGASVLLIRPYIKVNKLRITAFHIVFFIFVVSNAGGALTPIGDPPLFLGYLKGIPFFWITDRLILKWLFANTIILIVFYIFDYLNFKKQPLELEEKEIKAGERIVIDGIPNILLLLVIIGSVFITEPKFIREIIMLSAAFISYKFTKKEIHTKNHFNFHPIKEVAWLFLGIFLTMMPALELLTVNSKSLNISSPSQYYWLTGIMSAFLDNAPSYITYLTASMGYVGLNINNVSDVLNFLVTHEKYVIAISISSVFFGALTYIGNGPNFMVKSIAEHQSVKTPSFFGYMVKYSIPILLPLYILVWLIFIL